MITLEDKKRICARVFFQDNHELGEDGYEDFHEALAEFMSENALSETFIDFTIDWYLKPEEGHKIFMNDEGHVASVRLKDGYFAPRTDMTEEDGEKLQEAFHKAADENPNIKEIDLLPLIGWREI